MRIDAVQTIKDRLTMCEVLLHYGYEPNRAKFICCPFHNEKTPSMKIYEKDFLVDNFCFVVYLHYMVYTDDAKLDRTI